MRNSRLVLLAAACALAAAAAVPSAQALKGKPGGTAAPDASRAGGAVYGGPARFSIAQRPVVASLSVPRSVLAGAPPRISLRLVEPGVGTVYVRVGIYSLSTRRLVLARVLGWVHTGRTLRVGWPRGARLRPGDYHVSVAARDHRGGALLRRAHSSGVATLTVTAPSPAPPPATEPPPAPPPPAGVPTPAQTVSAGAVFPVAGPHSFGNAENRFGAPRGAHVHQGQDVLTAEGTPVLAPLAGTISTTGNQAGGAGYYVVEHTQIGFDLMFAHCQAASVAVAEGQAVAAGTGLCGAGQTGDATGPHLHFEMWVGGWQAPGGQPIDPLPYLEAWER